MDGATTIATAAAAPTIHEAVRLRSLAWLGVALCAAAWSWLRPTAFPGAGAGGFGVALLGAGGLCVLLAGVRARPGAALVLALSLLVVTGVGDALLARYEAYARPEAAVFSWIAWALGKAAGEPVALAGGDLLLAAEQGALRFAPTWSVVAFRPLVLFWLGALLLLAVRGRGARARVLGGAVLLPLLGLGLRYAWLVFDYAAVPDVLARTNEVAVASFWQPWGVLGVLAVAALLLGAKEPPFAWRGVEPGRSGAGRALACAALAGLALGAGMAWHDPGVPKQGRLLIDDRLTGYWEPAGRMLDTERYGDFSAYSFSAMVEHLSHRFVVSVNGHRAYTPEYLDGFDVLMLKTPEQPLAPEEIVAIREWVRAGGGLFAVSDHTDLMGMSTYLNELVEPFGITFAFDSTLPMAGGFDVWSQEVLPVVARAVGAPASVRAASSRAFPEHPVSAGLAPFECMTPCSLALRPPARAVMTLRHTLSSAGDYAKSSNFGGRAAGPDRHQGSLVLAAAAEVGAGRVLAFGDSTVLSSFAYAMGSHAGLVARGVSWLDRRRSVLGWLRWGFLGAGVLGVALALRALLGPARSAAQAAAGAPAAPAALALLAFGVVAGWAAAGTLAAQAVTVPAPMEGVVQVGFVQEGGHAWLPPVLGTQPELPEHGNLMTFVQTPQRLGFETRVVPRDPTVLADLDILVLLNPDVELGQPEAPAGWVEAVREWVHAGGRLIVLARRAHWGHEHDRAPLYLEGLHLEEAESPAEEIRFAVAGEGAGRVILVLGAEHLDVESMGHCMAYPGRAERRRYAAAYHAFGSLTGIAARDRRTYRPY